MSEFHFHRGKSAILQTLWATVHEGQIQLSENLDLPEGTKLLVTVLPDDEQQFWLAASQTSLAAVWDNAEDDAFAQLLDPGNTDESP
jgi:hypothetical protein